MMPNIRTTPERGCEGTSRLHCENGGGESRLDSGGSKPNRPESERRMLMVGLVPKDECMFRTRISGMSIISI